jgi:integrase
MHALGVPSKYAATRMGHADETMIRRVYQHIMETEENESTAKLNAYFGKMQNKMQNAV